MSLQVQNTLYVVTQGSYVHLDHDTLRVENDGATRLRVPLHQVGGLVVFGNVLVSPFAFHRCAEDGLGVVFLDRNGRFKARVEGPRSGNVLLRRAQHALVDDPERALPLVRSLLAAKLHNSRAVLNRAARETEATADEEALRRASAAIAALLVSLESAADVDSARGVEGMAAKHYFEAFTCMVRANRAEFTLSGRSRRPPLDRCNAVLSFLYALVTADCVAAVESVGLDPQLGILHALRPGRPALALDLVEGFRALVADRVALTLINRRQLQPDDFVTRPGGAVSLTDDARAVTIRAYQERKQELVTHPELNQRMPLGLVPLVQARLLARAVRDEPEQYLPFVPR